MLYLQHESMNRNNNQKQWIEIKKIRNNDNSRIHTLHFRSIHTHIGHHHILCHDTWVPELSWWSLEGRVQPCRFHQAGTVLYLPVPGINAYHPAEPMVSAEWLASEPCTRHAEKFASSHLPIKKREILREFTKFYVKLYCRLQKKWYFCMQIHQLRII